MNLEDKKGSHVSMVLSFIIFVVAIIFIYLIVSVSIPKSEPIKNALDNLEGNVLKSLNSEIWVLRYHEDPSSATCFNFTKPESITGGQTVAINDTSSVASSTSGNDILVENTNSTTKIYYSPFLENPNVYSGSSCTTAILDSARKENIISESQILEMMLNFSNNYASLKTKLEVPASMDFDLTFDYLNGTTLGSSESYPSTEIYSRELNLFFLSKNARNEEGKLRIRIW